MREPSPGACMQEERDFKSYVGLLRKWWWVFVLFMGFGVVVAGLLTYQDRRSHVDLYQARIKLLIEGGSNPLFVPTDSDTGKQLVQYYGDLIGTRPFLSRVAENLPFPTSPNALSDKISVARPGILIAINATDPDPVMAAQIANTTAQTLIEDLRDRQFAQLAQVQTSLNQYGIVQDSSITASQLARMVTLTVAENAQVPQTPSNSKKGLALPMFFGAVLGLLAAGSSVFVREQMDDRIKSPEQLRELTGLDVLGWVVHYETRPGVSPIASTSERRQAPLADAYRLLLANLEFASLRTQPLNSMLITSASPGEGKTTTATNLATSVAREGKSVILVDTDLRRPSLHKTFGLEGERGLIHLLLGTATLEETLAPTETPGLQVIPAGPIPPDPTYILRATVMKTIIEELVRRADLVIFDSPPLLVATDPLLIAPDVDAVLLVVDSERTSKTMVKRGADILSQANPPLVGAVLNKISTKPTHGYYHYSQYYSYYSSNDDSSDNGKSSLKRRLIPTFGRRKKKT